MNESDKEGLALARERASTGKTMPLDEALEVIRAPRRTTVFISPEDQEIIDRMVARFGGSTSEVIRRALRLEDELVTHQEDGWRVILQKGNKRETLRFLL